MEVTNFEIIEGGCCCILEIKLISTWNVNKKHMSENTWIVYTIYPDFFRDWDPMVFITIKLTTIRETTFGTFFFHLSIVDKARFPCVFGVSFRSIRVSTGSSFQNATADDRRPTFQVHEMTFPDGAAPPEAVFFFRSLLKQGSLYKVYPFLGGGESNNCNANLW